MRILHPEGAERYAERLRNHLPYTRPVAARWLGLEVKGDPIYQFVEGFRGMRAVLGPAAPEWAVAVCRGDDRIIFRLDLIDRQPASRLELVADHEIVHQLLNHLGGPRLPRWFEEGLCVTFAGLPFLEPNTTVELMAAAGNLPRLKETRHYFLGSGADAAQAYEVGHRAVRYLLRRHGEQSMRDILFRVGEGKAFEDAFRLSTGRSVEAFEEEWREAVTPPVPFWLYLMLRESGLVLLVAAAFLVFVGWLRWRLRRRRAFDSLGPAEV